MSLQQRKRVMDKTNHIKAPIFAIDRLRLGTDGHGITTLLYFMDCPLNCAYCLNDRCHGEVFESDGVTPRRGIMMLTPQELYDRVKIDNSISKQQVAASVLVVASRLNTQTLLPTSVSYVAIRGRLPLRPHYTTVRSPQ